MPGENDETKPEGQKPTTPEEPAEKPPSLRKGFLSETYKRHTSAMGDGSLSGGAPKPLPQRELRFILAASACLPGVFDEDFEVTLRGMTPNDEEAVALLTQSAGGSRTAGQKFLAMRMWREVNGDPFTDPGQQEWFWEAIGSAGRAIILTRCDALVDTGGGAGKAERTTRVTSR